MIDRITAAKNRELAWDQARHDANRLGIGRRIAVRERRRRQLAFARSSVVGVALFALAVRAFGFSGGPSNSEQHANASTPPAQLAMDDAGFHGDVALRD